MFDFVQVINGEFLGYMGVIFIIFRKLYEKLLLKADLKNIFLY